MDPVVRADETVSRFVFDRGKIRPDRVLWRAFWDPGEDVSVFRIDGLDAARIWAIGDVDRRGPAVGRGDLPVATVRAIGLDVVPDPDPERHALIRGWPHANRERAQTFARQLAAEAAPHLRP